MTYILCYCATNYMLVHKYGALSNHDSCIIIWNSGLYVRLHNQKYFSYFSTKTYSYVVGTQKKRLTKEISTILRSKFLPILTNGIPSKVRQLIHSSSVISLPSFKTVAFTIYEAHILFRKYVCFIVFFNSV